MTGRRNDSHLWRRRSYRVSVVAAALVAGVVGSASAASASGGAAVGRPGWIADQSRSVQTVATFDPAAAETPENLIVTGREIVVSLAFASTVTVLTPAGQRVQSVHLETAGGFIAGVALDVRRCAVAIAVSSPDAQVAGLYEADFHAGRLGTPARLASLPAGAFPNGLAFDPAGDLYAADSLLATIWRVPANADDGSPAQAWLRNPLLAPAGDGLPGANGVKVHAGRLYVSNTSRSTLLTVPLRGPRVGTVSVLRDDLRIDDFVIVGRDTLYAALNQANQVVRTTTRPGAPVEVLSDSADGVHNPSATAPTRDGRSLYVTNAAFDGPVPAPSLQRLSVRPGSHH